MLGHVYTKSTCLSRSKVNTKAIIGAKKLANNIKKGCIFSLMI